MVIMRAKVGLHRSSSGNPHRRIRVDGGRAASLAARSAVMVALALAVPLLFFCCTTMEKNAIAYVDSLPPEEVPGGVISAADLESLPPVARRYFRYSNVVRQGPEAKWMPFVSRQYNLLSEPARVFYIRTTKGPMSGVDSYLGGRGRMQIKLFDLITVADSKGPEMDKSGLVTFLNDLLFCPVAYFSLPIRWRQLDERRAELSLTHDGNTVTAVLTIDEAGRPVNWQSADRHADIKGEPLPDRWSTPMTAYGEVAGLRIPVAGRGVHDLEGTPAYAYTEIEALRDLAWNRRGLPPARSGRE
jgi:hypothetical protein